MHYLYHFHLYLTHNRYLSLSMVYHMLFHYQHQDIYDLETTLKGNE